MPLFGTAVWCRLLGGAEAGGCRGRCPPLPPLPRPCPPLRTCLLKFLLKNRTNAPMLWLLLVLTASCVHPQTCRTGSWPHSSQQRAQGGVCPWTHPAPCDLGRPRGPPPVPLPHPGPRLPLAPCAPSPHQALRRLTGSSDADALDSETSVHHDGQPLHSASHSSMLRARPTGRAPG